MKEVSKRALRRKHYRRLKAKRVESHYYGRNRETWSDRHLGAAVSTPCNCSCFMCGNPRRSNAHEAFSLAERRHLDSMQDQLDAYHQGDDTGH